MAPPLAAPELRRARAKPVIPLALAGMAVILGVAVVNGWFGGRSASVPASSAPESVAVSAPAPKSPPMPALPPEPRDPPAPDAVPQVPVAAPAVPAVPAVVESKPTPKPASQGKREGMSEAVRAELKEAERALADGHFQEATRLGLRILRKGDLRETETQAAEALLARAYCRQSDLSAARAHWRRLPPAGKREVRQYCKKYLDF
jgi:serine/threonine-protein kinase